MLDLKSRIDLEEEEASRIDDELDRTGVPVASLARDGDRGLGERAALLARERGRRCLLDDLLVAPLRGAVPLAEAQDVAAVVGGDLHLEMAGSLDEPFQQQPLVAESGRCHPPGTRERFT